jgi:hypothetical protein
MDHIGLAKQWALGKIFQPRLREDAGRLDAPVTSLFAKNRKLIEKFVHGVSEVQRILPRFAKEGKPGARSRKGQPKPRAAPISIGMKAAFTAIMSALIFAFAFSACTSSAPQSSGPKFTTGDAGESPGMRQHTSGGAQ